MKPRKSCLIILSFNIKICAPTFYYDQKWMNGDQSNKTSYSGVAFLQKVSVIWKVFEKGLISGCRPVSDLICQYPFDCQIPLGCHYPLMINELQTRQPKRKARPSKSGKCSQYPETRFPNVPQKCVFFPDKFEAEKTVF